LYLNGLLQLAASFRSFCDQVHQQCTMDFIVKMHPVDINGCILYGISMAGESRYLHALEPLLARPMFTVIDAAEHGIPRQALGYFIKKGLLERVYPGTYRSVNYELLVDFEWEGLAQAAASIPNGVICLISALCYHHLTDQVMRESWIAVPHLQRAPKRLNTRVVRMRNLELGKTETILGEYHVHIFNRERCVVDAFRYLDKEIAIKALKRYLHGRNYKPDLKKLQDYAKELRVNLTPYILAYTI
jgi:predicted transcriptional regulator of viral defense system